MLGRITGFILVACVALGCGEASQDSTEIIISSCSDGEANGDETGVDCGGMCAACEIVSPCETAADCEGRACVAGACETATACQTGADCESVVCTDGLCVDAICTDGVQNGAELGIDCGGDCGNCELPAECAMPSDCSSGVCTDGSCIDATCGDTIRNGVETDVDCGGDCMPCADGFACESVTDCDSGQCEEGRCAATRDLSYPDGPYGTSVGETAMDLTLGTADGGETSFGEIRVEDGARLLLIFSTAAWCGRCAGDMPELIQLHERHQANGLRMRVSLFESADHGEPSQRDADLYGRGNGLPFPVLVDKTGQLHPFFPRIALPMVMIVDLESMALVHADIGWSLESFESLVSDRLSGGANTP